MVRGMLSVCIRIKDSTHKDVVRRREDIPVSSFLISAHIRRKIMYQYVLLDLDGTLTDSGEGIRNSAAYALEKFGIRGQSSEELNRFIGPPLYVSFETFYGFSHEDALKAVAYYREYFSETGIFENRVIDGIPEVLQALRQAGCTCVLATSKPRVYAERILEHFGLAEYFAFVSAATLDNSICEKPDIIRQALQGYGISGNAVMVGDREHDVNGAKVCGLDCIGVLFGYGSREELELAGAAAIAADAQELAELLGVTWKGAEA